MREGGCVHKLISLTARPYSYVLFWVCTKVCLLCVCVMHRSTAGCRNCSQQHLSAAVMLIGSQFKEFFPLQMEDAAGGKCTHACLHAHMHAHTQTHTQLTDTNLGSDWSIWWRKKKRKQFKAKVLQGCGGGTCVFSRVMPTTSTAVETQGKTSSPSLLSRASYG